MKSIIYLLCGVSGSGKTWIAGQVKHLIYYSSYDKLGRVNPTRTTELHDCTVHISTTIKRLREDGHTVLPLFVLGDKSIVESQLLNRGGRVNDNFHRRWARIEKLSTKLAHVSGSSSEILGFLLEKLQQRITKHLIYKAVSPSGKVYVGKTSQPLDKRIYDHKIYAKTHDTPFAKAIKKYGDGISFSILEEVIGLQLANEREQFFISKNDCVSPKGYNLTVGGDGGKRSPDSEKLRIAKVTKAWQNLDLKKTSAATAKRMWSTKRNEVTAKIKSARSTLEAKSATSKLSKEAMTDPTVLKKLAEAGRKRYKNQEERAKSAAAMRRVKARLFEGFKDGIKIGEWLHKADASKDLGIHYTGISSVLSGRIKQTWGYTFKYSDSKDPTK